MTPQRDKAFQWRAVVVTAALLGVYSLVAARLFQYQITSHDELLAKAKRNRMMTEIIPARRGEILDRNGETLAKDRLMRQVYVDRKHLFQPEQIVRFLAGRMGMSGRDLKLNYTEDELANLFRRRLYPELAVKSGKTPEAIEAAIKDKSQGAPVIQNLVDQDLAGGWKDFVEENGLKGIYLRPVQDRVYPVRDYLVSIVGDTKPVAGGSEGKEGIELTMEKLLKGKPGQKTFEADAHRRKIPAFPTVEIPAKNGGSVMLSVDAALQEKVERMAREAREQYHAEKVFLIVTKPKTGDILAMADSPTYTRASPPSMRRNRIVGDVFEPGSIFKIVTFAIALDEGLVSLTDTIFCENGVYSEGLEHPIHDTGPYGRLLVSDVLAKSSNIGTYKIIMSLGREKFARRLKEFGFGEKTGLALNGESSGILRDSSAWHGDSLSRIGMGQEIAVSSMQIMMAAGAIANGGMLMKPRLILETRDGNGKLIKEYVPEGKRVISEEAARDTTEAMVSVVDHGTGRNAAIPSLVCAGKTGTAEKPKRGGGGYYHDRYVVSFIGFVTGLKEPLLALAVVDDPENAVHERYGSVVAAPLWKKLMVTTLEHEGLTNSNLSSPPMAATDPHP